MIFDARSFEYGFHDKETAKGTYASPKPSDDIANWAYGLGTVTQKPGDGLGEEVESRTRNDTVQVPVYVKIKRFKHWISMLKSRPQ